MTVANFVESGGSLFSDEIGDREVGVADDDKEDQKQKDPPGAAHEGELICKAEGSGLAAPVEEEVRVVDAFCELPVVHVSDACIDCVEDRRDDHIKGICLLN